MKYMMFVVADPAAAAEAEPYDGELTSRSGSRTSTAAGSG